MMIQPAGTLQQCLTHRSSLSPPLTLPAHRLTPTTLRTLLTLPHPALAPETLLPSCPSLPFPLSAPVFLTVARFCGAGAAGFSAASLAARLAKFCWWRLPCAWQQRRVASTLVSAPRPPCTSHASVPGCMACKHMLFNRAALTCLRVCQVVALIGVKSQTQAALDLTQVVAHVVWVLGQVDCLQRQPSQPLSAVDRLRHGGIHAYMSAVSRSGRACHAWEATCLLLAAGHTARPRLGAMFSCTDEAHRDT